MLNARSPHVLIPPDQIETGLTDVKGLDTQVDEVVRTLDVFLGYATFRDQLGGTVMEKLKGIRKLYRRGNGQGPSFRGRMNSWDVQGASETGRVQSEMGRDSCELR